jgi:uncharacterized membrane protein YraQ (UPF0718 family)
MRRGKTKLAAAALFFLFLGVSLMTGFHPGLETGRNFRLFTLDMLKILPCAFILIGLFEVWVKKETVEKHLGEGSLFMGYVWAFLLAGTTVGGLYVAFPVAYSLYRKGAKLSVIFTYISAAAVFRVPMAVFEASFMGVKFTAIRLLVSLPLILFSSILLGRYLKKKQFRIEDGDNSLKNDSIE